MPLNHGGAVGEEDAEELKREEAEVEVHGGEEGEERVEGCCGGEEYIRVAYAGIVAYRLQGRKSFNTCCVSR